MAETVISELRIDADRLYRSLEELGQIGSYDDERAGLRGVRRLALSDADGEGRLLVKRWCEEAGLSVRVDQIGNLYAERAGTEPGLAPVLSGSHLDSVPTAGRFDGALGVLAALEVIRTLNDAGVQTRRPLVAAVFTEEEGCRFGTDMLGSAVAAGRIPLAEAHDKTDPAGVRVRDELERIGFLGDEEIGARRPHAFVECHIEQGPLLIQGDMELGVVTGVQGISWWELSLAGRSAHAGTTPTHLRSDAGLVAALINVRMREMAESGKYGEMRATMGVVQPQPGVVNVIPGRVHATVDLRNPDDALLTASEQDLQRAAESIAGEHGVEIGWRQTARTPPIPFDASVQQVIAGVASAFELRHHHLIAGAGHDAQEWAAVCKTAMIFVPGEHDGISHNPRELSTPQQCADGANVLLHTLLRLAEEKDGA